MLTDAQVRKALPREKDYKLADEKGLYLFVTTKGFKSWRYKYRHAGKEHRLTFGAYPEVSLAEARHRRDDARRQLRDHQNPATELRKAKMASIERAGLTFEKLARAWHENEKGRWADVHAYDVLHSLERDVFPEIGNMSIKDIDAPTVLATLRKVERRGSIETARRIRQRISAVFVYAISEGVGDSDPAAIVTKALKPLPKKGKQPALTDIDQCRQLIIDSEASGATPVVKLASRLLALTSVRPGVIRGIGWSEFEDLEGYDPIWRIPAARMKLALHKKDEEAFEHIVPLSRQAVDVIVQARRLTGRCPLVFPSIRHSHQPMSENAIGYLYNRVGYHGRHVPHGWRAAFSTIMNELYDRAWRAAGHKDASPDRAIIDLMLSHVPQNKVESAYNRAAYMPRRREIAQEWADLLMEGVMGAKNLLKD